MEAPSATMSKMHRPLAMLALNVYVHSTRISVSQRPDSKPEQEGLWLQVSEHSVYVGRKGMAEKFTPWHPRSQAESGQERSGQDIL